jgi:peptide chain release factor 1
MNPSIRNKLDKLVERHEEVSALLADPQIIANNDKFRELSMEYSRLEPVVSRYRDYGALLAERIHAQEMVDGADVELRELGQEELATLTARMERESEELAKLLLPKDARDESNIYLEVRAGTGGDEAAIFAGDLFRMYSRYADNQGWRVEVLSESAGEHGGYKEVISRVVGRGAFSRFKFEAGTHRVQRVPATEAQGRIHTSACTVAILPEVAEVEAVELNPAELRIDTFRSSGAGGQHVNKTDSAIRITHIPTGIIVACQADRSQHRNRAMAMQMLKARLYEAELQKREEAAAAVEATKSDIGWGHQIRSYVLQPYQMVKDLRTEVETSDTGGVLDGDIDRFLSASLAAKVHGGEPAA